MPKTRHVKATFSDGTVLTRGSISRHYTHAYLYRSTYLGNAGTSREGEQITAEKTGFSTSGDQARRNMDGETAYIRRYYPNATLLIAEVVEVEVLS